MAKFCGYCGRKLEDGEVCNCRSQSAGQGTRGQSSARRNDVDVIDVRNRRAAGQQEAPRRLTQEASGRQAQEVPRRQAQEQSGRQAQEQPRRQAQDPRLQSPQGRTGERDPYSGRQSRQQYGGGQQGAYYDGAGGRQNSYRGRGAYDGGQDPYDDQEAYDDRGGYDDDPYGQGRGYSRGRNYAGGRGREMEWLNRKKTAFVSVTRNMFAEILPILKAPVSRAREIAGTNSMAVGMEFIITKFAVCIILLLVMVMKLFSFARSYGVSLGDMNIHIPYFRLLLALLFLTAGIDLLRALIQKGMANAFGGRLSFSGSVTIIGEGDMYQSLFGLAGGLLMFLLPVVGAIIIGIGFLISPFVEYGAFIGVVEGNENRKPYAYCISTVLAVIASALVVALVGSSAVAFLDDVMRMF